jgi:hypothetical protein
MSRNYKFQKPEGACFACFVVARFIYPSERITFGEKSSRGSGVITKNILWKIIMKLKLNFGPK